MAVISIATLDFGRLADVADLDKARARIDQAASLTRAEWVRLAKRRLRNPETRRDYLRGLQPVERLGGHVLIQLTGKLPNMIERGWPATDLRQTMLSASAKGVRTSKKGYRYRYIMFRRYMYGKRVSQHMPQNAAHNIEQKIKILRRVARALKPTREVAGRGRVWGERTTAKKMREIGIRKARAHHALSLMAGLYRFEHSYGGRKQGSYGNFRTISTNPSSHRPGPHGDRNWLHPGIRARWISRDVREYLRLVVIPQVFAPGGVP